MKGAMKTDWCRSIRLSLRHSLVASAGGDTFALFHPLPFLSIPRASQPVSGQDVGLRCVNDYGPSINWPMLKLSLYPATYLLPGNFMPKSYQKNF